MSDYGLALSREFELEPDERQFLDAHANFDVCTAVNSLAHAVVTRYVPGPDWRQALRELTDRPRSVTRAMPDAIRTYLVQRAPLALAMGEFYGRLTADLTTAYPAARLRRILDGY